MLKTTMNVGFLSLLLNFCLNAHEILVGFMFVFECQDKIQYGWEKEIHGD